MAGILDNFKPFRGDLFYGCDAARQKYLVFLNKYGRGFVNITDFWLMPNDYNNNTILSFKQYYTPNETPSEATKEAQILKLKESVAQVSSHDANSLQGDMFYKAQVEAHNRQLGEKFVEGLYQKYDPAAVKSLDAQELQRKTGDSHNFKMIRRSCKYGFEHVLKCIDDQLTPEAKIHFVLDEMKIEDVLKKSKLGPDHRVPITTSELRFCFRRWDALKNIVYFYSSYRDVPAPWESAPGPWYDYATARVSTYLSLLADKTIPVGKVPLKSGAIVDMATASLTQLREGGNFLKEQLSRKNLVTAVD